MPFGPMLWAHAVLAVTLVIAAATDVRSGKIYNVVTYPAIAIGLVGHTVLGGLMGEWLPTIYPLRQQLAPVTRRVRAYGLPGYLTGALSVIVGTLLVLHLPSLLAPVLLFAAVLTIFLKS